LVKEKSDETIGREKALWGGFVAISVGLTQGTTTRNAAKKETEKNVRWDGPGRKGRGKGIAPTGAPKKKAPNERNREKYVRGRHLG